MINKIKNPIGRKLLRTTTLGCTVTGALFTIYILNLDQKLLAWSYKKVNEMNDRKSTDSKS